MIEPGKNGVFTDGSPSHLAESITALLRDTERREKIGQEARKITEKYERKKLIAEYVEFLKKMAKD